MAIYTSDHKRRGESCMLRNQRGWLLVDALIAMVFISTALLAILFGYKHAIAYTTTMQNYNQALHVARQKVEELKVYDNEALAELEYAITNINSNPISTINNMNYTIRVSPPSPVTDNGVYNVVITVEWAEQALKDMSKKNNKQIDIANYYYVR
jgi:Tfp pilus assembly protein PilV